MTSHLLMTGNELMTGVTVDTNACFLAGQLTSLGIKVNRKITVGDNRLELQQAINDSCREADLLIINGGLGPTSDDLTAEVLARVAGVALQISPEAESHVRQWCQRRGLKANDANLKQALLPEGATMINNPLGSAPGIFMRVHDCLVLCTPGVPSEMKAMFNEELKPLLLENFPDSRQQVIRRLQVFGLGESSMQQRILNEFPKWPDNIELGFRAGLPSLELKLTTHRHEHLQELEQWQSRLMDLFGLHVFGSENDTLPAVLVNLLKERQLTLTSAESCTGGLVASQVTSVPGASGVFEAGFVTYSNGMKHELLNVDEHILRTEGAVSEAVVRAMAAGALDRSHADLAIAVSGIAGPDGGSEEKPVGTVCICWGSRDKLLSTTLHYPTERHSFQAMIAAIGLDLVRRFVLGEQEIPRYIEKRQGKTPG